MLDIKYISRNTEHVKKALQYRCEPGLIDTVVALYSKRNAMLSELDKVRQGHKKGTAKIAALASTPPNETK